METFRIRFMVKCSSCGFVDRCDFKRLGQSHVDWIRTAEKDRTISDWKCRVCKAISKAEVYQVFTEKD